MSGSIWRTLPIGQVTKRSHERIYPSNNNELRCLLIDLENIEEHTGRLINASDVYGSEINSTKSIFREGDVLYGRLRPYLNKVHLAGQTGICSPEIWVLRANPDLVLPEYLAYYLRSSHVLDRVRNVGVGANLPRLDSAIFDALPIPIPPLSEQRQIVEILDLADLLRRRRVEADRRFATLLPTLLFEMFGDPATNPHQWTEVEFGAVVSYSKYGPRFPDARYSSAGTRILRTTDMTPTGEIRWWEAPRIALDASDTVRHALRPRTLLVTRSGTIGRCALFRGASEPCIAGAYLLEFGLKEAVDEDYLLAFFTCPHGQRQLLRGATQMTQPNINAPAVKAIRLPLPPLPLQREFGSRAKRVAQLADSQAASGTRIEELFASLSQRAFTGQLTGEAMRRPEIAQ